MIFVAVILLVALGYFIWAYNTLVRLRNQAKEAWSDIDVQLKRRYNLIPNIVETVKGYTSHEESVLTKVTEARAKAINAGTIKDQGEAENLLNGALKSLFAVSENYPDLKANENFMQLQNELVDTEDKIQSARRYHNGVVRDFNTMVEQLPSKAVAQLCKFTPLDFFEIKEETERENVVVSFEKKEPAVPAAAPQKAEEKKEAQASLPLDGPGEPPAGPKS